MKKIISLSLSIMMLISFLVPNSAVLAQDEAKEITEKVTQGLPDVVIKGNTDKDLVKDGVLVGDKNLGKSGTIEINYKWEISKVKGNGINAGDYFLVPLPEIPTIMVNKKEEPLLKGAGFDPNVPIDIRKDGEVLGNFVVDTTAGHIKATLSPLAVEKQAITDGFFKIKFTLQDHAEIIVDAAAPNKKDILKFIKRIPPKEPLPGGVNRPDHDFKKGGVEVSGDDVVRWEMHINQKQMVEYMEGRPFESKENVWIEDELSGSNLTIQTFPIRIYANFFLATEEGKMGSYAYRTSPINATVAAGNLVLSTSEDNTFEEFKTRVKALPDKKPLTVYVYQRKDDSQKDGILFYVGNLNETDAKTYDEIYPGVEQSVDADLKAFLADGRINQARYDNTRSLFGIDDDPSTKMKKVMGYKLVFDTKVAGKTIAGNVAQMVWDNGQPLSGKALAKYDGKATGGAGYVETTAVIVEKKWEGKEGGPVTVNLLQNGSPFRTVKLGVQNPSGANETSAWSFVFSELPKQDAGKTDYVYSVEEVAMENYTTTYAPANKTGQNIVITNTYIAPKTLTFKVKKEWVGPATGDSVVSLYGKDKNVALQTRTLSANALTATFDEVPEFDDTNTKIDYTLEETTVPANAEKLSINLEADNTFVVKNRNTEKVDASITKKWLGEGKDVLTVYLTINGNRSRNPLHKFELQSNTHEEFNWKATVKNLPKYDENGDFIRYSFEEELPAGYTQKPIEQTENNVVITNVNDATFHLPVEKKWVGPAQASAEIQLVADDKEVAGKTLTLNDGNNWKSSFNDLRVFDANTGKRIEYTVKENNVPANYVDSVAFKNDNDIAEGYVVTNKNVEKLEIPVEKKWVGPEGNDVVIQLVADNAVVPGKEITLNAGNSWKDKFSDLFVYDQTSGQKIVYTVQEKVVPVNHKVEVSAVDANDVTKGFLVKNTNISKLNVNVEKKWVNSSVASVKANLFADGKLKESVELNAGNSWKHSFTDLFQYDQETGLEIKYTVTEDEVPNFSTDIKGDRDNGFVITNTYLPPLTPYVPGDSEPSDPRPTPPTTEEPKNPEPTTPPSDNVPENPIPQGDPNKPNVPTTPQTPNVPTVPTVPETTVPENPIPQGKTELPKTDGVPAGAMHFFGLAISAIGLLLKKKK